MGIYLSNNTIIFIRIYIKLRSQRIISNIFIEILNSMAKKINKSKKPKLVRSSSIQKTIDEGKDYVVRADRRLRIRNRNKAPTQPQHLFIRKTKPVKKAVNKKKTARAPKSSASNRRSRPSHIAAGVPIGPAPTPITPVPAPVVRTSSKNLSRSGSKNLAKTSSKNNQIIIEQQLQDRLGRHNANIGKLNFSLRWWDPNDLDLHVVCPCGTQIYYANKKCLKCNGQLDIDMNVGMNMSLEPVEHVFFNKPKPGLYKFFVKYFYGPKQFSGVRGKQNSKYALSLHEDLNQIFRYEDEVSNKRTQMHYDFNR